MFKNLKKLQMSAYISLLEKTELSPALSLMIEQVIVLVESAETPEIFPENKVFFPLEKYCNYTFYYIQVYFFCVLEQHKNKK